MAESQLLPRPSMELLVALAKSVEEYYQQRPDAEEEDMLNHIRSHFGHGVNGDEDQLTQRVLEMITAYSELYQNNVDTLDDHEPEKTFQFSPYLIYIHYAFRWSEKLRNRHKNPSSQPMTTPSDVTTTLGQQESHGHQMAQPTLNDLLSDGPNRELSLDTISDLIDFINEPGPSQICVETQVDSPDKFLVDKGVGGDLMSWPSQILPDIESFTGPTNINNIYRSNDNGSNTRPANFDYGYMGDSYVDRHLSHLYGSGVEERIVQPTPSSASTYTTHEEMVKLIEEMSRSTDDNSAVNNVNEQCGLNNMGDSYVERHLSHLYGSGVEERIVRPTTSSASTSTTHEEMMEIIEAMSRSTYDNSAFYNDNDQCRINKSRATALEVRMDSNISKAEEWISSWPQFQSVEELSLKPYTVIEGGTKETQWPVRLKFKICGRIEYHYKKNITSELDAITRAAYSKKEVGVSETRFTWRVGEMIKNYQNLRREIGDPDTAHCNKESIVRRCPYFFHIHKALSYSDHYERANRLIDLRSRPSMHRPRTYINPLHIMAEQQQWSDINDTRYRN